MSSNNHRKWQESRQLDVVFSFNFVLVIVILLKSGLISNLTMRLELLSSAYIYAILYMYPVFACLLLYLHVPARAAEKGNIEMT